MSFWLVAGGVVYLIGFVLFMYMPFDPDRTLENAVLSALWPLLIALVVGVMARNMVLRVWDRTLCWIDRPSEHRG